MTFQISSEIKTTVADSSTCHVSTNGNQRVKSSRKGRGLGPHPASAHQHLACKRVSLSTAYLVIPITSSLTPVISISPAPQQWSVSHTTAYERLTVMARERMQYTQHLQPSALHLPSLSTSALPLSSVSMCPCAYESVFYLHYPCLLLATETKYFKAERQVCQLACCSSPCLQLRKGAGGRSLQTHSISRCALRSHALEKEAWLAPSWRLLGSLSSSLDPALMNSETNL